MALTKLAGGRGGQWRASSQSKRSLLNLFGALSKTCPHQPPMPEPCALRHEASPTVMNDCGQTGDATIQTNEVLSPDPTDCCVAAVLPRAFLDNLLNVVVVGLRLRLSCDTEPAEALVPTEVVLLLTGIWWLWPKLIHPTDGFLLSLRRLATEVLAQDLINRRSPLGAVSEPGCISVV
eukprot:CAMPEP_0115230636 /NCGR_PEP_ID=MMETSP0270-20121206/32818_1 /TAXON_ID=71861 /ORGANISM="Scrippsiella trochoidea, Strain CCMP3099" /LENGTH=177 /DNA_ID=CAMNT_0002645235 /DNA_START=190 /DNA_END=724 /DNA_ORIENTATION=-